MGLITKTQSIARGVFLIAVMALVAGCAAMKSFFAADAPQTRSIPIQNPFGELYPDGNPPKNNIVLRTKKGDRSVEVELPASDQAISDFVVPMSPAFREGGGDARGPASVGPGEVDERLRDAKPTLADREITNGFPKGQPEDEAKRREIEQGLGVTPSEEDTPSQESSYLAGLDHVKQLYKTARFEAALIEIDGMLRLYQTDPKLYQMRGTILDRLGHKDLAVKSWIQALRLEPKNESLRRFIERKAKGAGVAMP